MPRIHPEPTPSPLTELVEHWLAEHLRPPTSGAAAKTRLPSGTLPDLLDTVRTVLLHRPVLAQAARQLSTFDQFRLTLEPVRAAGLAPDPRPGLAEPICVTAARRSAACFTRRPGRRRPEPK